MRGAQNFEPAERIQNIENTENVTQKQFVDAIATDLFRF